jgi:hypothetical protein
MKWWQVLLNGIADAVGVALVIGVPVALVYLIGGLING